MTYAKNTKVDVERTVDDIRRTLRSYGTVESFAFIEEGQRAAIVFTMYDRQVRLVLELPAPEDFRLTGHRPPRKRTQKQWEDAYSQACRQRWRALLLVVKAKLEAVAAGIATFETEFMAHIVLPDSRTVGEWMTPQISKAYEHNEMPSLLPVPRDSQQTPTDRPIPLPPA